MSEGSKDVYESKQIRNEKKNKQITNERKKLTNLRVCIVTATNPL